MQVQLNTDNHVPGSRDLSAWVDAEVHSALKRFADRVSRVEMHLHDLNSGKHSADKRCVVEARVAGRPPLSVTADAPIMDRAIHGALDKLVHALDHALGKQDSARHAPGVAPATDEES